jgi:hypothetical protein
MHIFEFFVRLYSGNVFLRLCSDKGFHIIEQLFLFLYFSLSFFLYFLFSCYFITFLYQRSNEIEKHTYLATLKKTKSKTSASSTKESCNEAANNIIISLIFLSVIMGHAFCCIKRHWPHSNWASKCGCPISAMKYTTLYPSASDSKISSLYEVIHASTYTCTGKSVSTIVDTFSCKLSYGNRLSVTISCH